MSRFRLAERSGQAGCAWSCCVLGTYLQCQCDIDPSCRLSADAMRGVSFAPPLPRAHGTMTRRRRRRWRCSVTAVTVRHSSGTHVACASTALVMCLHVVICNCLLLACLVARRLAPPVGCRCRRRCCCRCSLSPACQPPLHSFVPLLLLLLLETIRLPGCLSMCPRRVGTQLLVCLSCCGSAGRLDRTV